MECFKWMLGEWNALSGCWAIVECFKWMLDELDALSACWVSRMQFK